jgi:hypothetical protein
MWRSPDRVTSSKFWIFAWPLLVGERTGPQDTRFSLSNYLSTRPVLSAKSPFQAALIANRSGPSSWTGLKSLYSFACRASAMRPNQLGFVSFQNRRHVCHLPRVILWVVHGGLPLGGKDSRAKRYSGVPFPSTPTICAGRLGDLAPTPESSKSVPE